LEAIHQSHHQVVGVVTVADKASGRGQKINQSPVKYMLQKMISLFFSQKAKRSRILEELRKLDADVFVVVAFRMMPKVCLKCLKWERSIFMLLSSGLQRSCSYQLCCHQW
jgi:methionyl-tRNA formyltransferase